jgi:NADH-quinone oxidoreductase subunit I
MIVLEPRKYSLWERIWIPEVVRGLALTMRHFARNLLGVLTHERVIPTYEYPEEPIVVPARARNVHRLTLREDGSPRCVACLMCETICPAECITIEAMESPDPVKEKVCKSFVIDELRCIFCGFCVEACPVDAIRMDTSQSTLARSTREEFVFDRERLLGHARREDAEEEGGEP